MGTLSAVPTAVGSADWGAEALPAQASVLRPNDNNAILARSTTIGVLAVRRGFARALELLGRP